MKQRLIMKWEEKKKNFGRNLAIIIGINQYQNGIAKLKTAKPDAETLADLLRDEYHYQVELITDDTEHKPTQEELKNLLKELPEKLQPPAENNRLLFYFAGHGMSLESNDGPRGFLLPQNADPKKPDTFLSMQVLHDALVALPCHHLLVILDCCFAGTFRWASTREMILIPEAIHQEHYDRFIRYPAWQVITSAAHNQEALDFLSDKRGISKKSQAQEKKHSPFAEALFEALQDGDPDEKGRRYKKADLTKDGVITAPELYLYLRDNVETRSNERQTPGLYPLKKHDRGEYIFHDPNFDPQTLSKADPIDETNNPYRGLKPFEEEHARFFFGRQELIENLYARIAAPDHSLTVVLGVSGSGKSSLVKAGLIPYLRELSEPEVFAVNLVKVCILTSAILDVFPKFLFLPQLLPINDLHQWHILNPIRPGESPFAALARTIWALANIPTSVQLDSLGFLSEQLNQKTEQLNTKVDEASWEHGETSRTTQRLKQEAEKFAQITATWNQDTHAAKQLLIVEHFETLYALCQTPGEAESQQQRQLKQVFLACLNPLTERLQSAPNSFVEIVKAWSQKHPGVKLLLVIDQFEELITLTRKAQPNQQSDTPEEWLQFLQLLETTLAANLPQLRIVVTLRSDFEPRFLNSEALKSYWTRARFPVRAMRSDELRQAIEGPASEMALYFEPANLVDRLIDEVGQMPGALPLLSFTLSELYIKLAEKWRDRKTSDRALTIDVSFEKEGGVAGSLTRRATEEYNKIGEDKELGEAAQTTMRRVMLRMLTLDGGGIARRQVTDSELVYLDDAENIRRQKLINNLVAVRLLVKGQQETGEPYVEPAHDFLVRGWGMLQDWLDEERKNETLELRQRLAAQANDWERNGRPNGSLWSNPDDARLKQLEQILQLTNNWFNQRETEFINSSIEQAKKIRARPELQEKAGRIQNLLPAQPVAGLVLAIQSLGQNLAELPNDILSSVQSSLLEAIEISRECNLLKAQYSVSEVAISRDGQTIITIHGGIVQLWERQGNPVGQPFQEQEGDFVMSVAISADGQTIVSGSSKGTVHLWDRQGNSVATVVEAHKNRILSVAISADGQTIVSGSEDGTVRLWDAQLRSISQPLQAQAGSVYSVTSSANGQTIVSGTDDGKVQVWDREGKPIGQPLQGHSDRVLAVAVSWNGQTIVSGGAAEDRNLRLWEAQIQPIGQRFYGNQSGITSVAINPDGQTIFSGSKDGTLRLWNREGLPIGEVLHEDVIYSVAISSDGQMLVSGGADKTVRLWDNKGNAVSQPFQGHNGRIYSVAISPDRQTIVSGSGDGTVRLWDTQGNPVGNPLWHKEIVWSVAISSDAQTIVSGSKDGTLRLWDRRGHLIGEPIQVCTSYEGVTLVAISTDGQIIVTRSSDGTVRLWDRNDHLQGYLLQGHQQRIVSVAIGLDGQYIVSGNGDGTVQLWDLQGNSIGEPVQGHEGAVKSVVISPDGQTIVSGSEDGTVRLWDKRIHPIGQPFKGHKLLVASVAISSDGQTIVSGSNDRTVRLWDRQGNPIGQPLQGHRDDVTSVAISSDRQTILSGGGDKTIRFWDTQRRPIGQPFQGHNGWVYSVAISTDGQTIVSGSGDGTLRLWDRQGNAIGKPFWHKELVLSVAISKDGQTIVSGCKDGSVRLWDTQGNLLGQPIQATSSSEGVWSVALSSDGQMIVSGSYDGAVRLWDRQGNSLGQSGEQGHKGYVTSVAISANGQTIVSGSADGTVRLWDAKGKPLGQPFQGHESVVTSVAVLMTSDGLTIVSGSEDRTVQLWDFQGKRIGQPFQGHEDAVISVTISPDGQIVVSGSADGTVRMWDRQGNLIGQPCQHTDRVTSVAISSDGQTIVSGSWDKTVQLWRGGNWKNWLQVACDRLRHHPVFKDPETIEDLEQRKIAIAACETCRKYVWSKEDTSV